MARRAIIPVFIPHAGCPHNCVFCDQRSISGQAGMPSRDEIIRAIEDGLALSPAGAELAFYGGSFTAIGRGEMEGVLSCAAPYIRDGRLSGIRVSTRPDTIDEGVLKLLKEYGVDTIELGAQSMDAGVLKKSGRGHTPEDTANAALLIRARGFALILQLMCGLPGDSAEGFLKTCAAAASLGPDGVRIYPTAVLEGTPLAAMYRAGIYAPLDNVGAAKLCAAALAVFAGAKIPVIRIGLNPSDGLAGRVIAGAYHPALGEMARSEYFYGLAKARILEQGGGFAGQDLEISVHKSRVGIMAGQRGANKAALIAAFSFRSVRILGDFHDPDSLSIKINAPAAK